jgi:hypothetical protein
MESVTGCVGTILGTRVLMISLNSVNIPDRKVISRSPLKPRVLPGLGANPNGQQDSQENGAREQTH